MATSRVHHEQPFEILEPSLSDIKLRHSEVIWVLSRLGFQGSATTSTFYEYIKSLRKFGIPIKRGAVGRVGRGRAYYSYQHLMELALVLTLRVYYFVPDSVLAGVIRHRDALSRYYRRAYAERESHTGAPVLVRVTGHAPFRVAGVFLDLQLNFSGGRLVRFGPPRLLSPFEALTVFAHGDTAARAFQPINLSLLAERIVSTTLQTRERG
jgi:hypothetical protein